MATQTLGGGLTHFSIAKRYRFAIAGTLILLAFENVFTVLEPFLLGRVIDGLIARDYANLWIFLAAALTALAIGVLRRVYDTRVYGRIYRETATETVARENEAGRAVTQVVARVNFVKEFADFFEQMLPAALMSAIMLVGAVIMMAVLSPLLCIATLGVTVLVAAIFLLSRRRLTFLNAQFNDEMERQVDVLVTRDATQVGAHFSSLVRWRIALSDLEARNFGGVFLLTFLLTALAAFIMIVVEDKTEGQVFAALTYVLQFSQSVIILPYTYQQYIRTNEISARLNEKDESEEASTNTST